MSEQNKARTPEQIQADIVMTRARLTSTIDEITYRVDLRVKLEELKVRAQGLADEARGAGERFLESVKEGDPKAIGAVAGVAALGVLMVVAAVRSDD